MYFYFHSEVKVECRTPFQFSHKLSYSLSTAYSFSHLLSHTCETTYVFRILPSHTSGRVNLCRLMLLYSLLSPLNCKKSLQRRINLGFYTPFLQLNSFNGDLCTPLLRINFLNPVFYTPNMQMESFIGLCDYFYGRFCTPILQVFWFFLMFCCFAWLANKGGLGDRQFLQVWHLRFNKDILAQHQIYNTRQYFLPLYLI